MQFSFTKPKLLRGHVSIQLRLDLSDDLVQANGFELFAELREDLEFERSENGWAREFLNRMGQKCGTKDCPSLVAYVTKMEGENKELRELARGLGQCAQGVSCEDCLLYDLSEPDHCREERLSRSLGVEAHVKEDE